MDDGTGRDGTVTVLAGNTLLTQTARETRMPLTSKLTLLARTARRSLSSTTTPAKRNHLNLRAWATVDPHDTSKPLEVKNLVRGEWTAAAGGKTRTFPDPLTGLADAIVVPDTQLEELQPFRDFLSACPKSGLHNPLKNPEKYVQLGQAMHLAGEALDDPAIRDFFTKLVQRTMPKSWAQCEGEIRITATFLKTFAGDATRFLVARGFSVPGDHAGQYSSGYRFPFGPVCIIAPFNFPLEIPALQLVGAILAGNRAVLKPAEKVAPVAEQFVRLLLACGVSSDYVALLNASGSVTEALVAGDDSPVRMTQFTGSTHVAEALTRKTRGRIRMEDAGFNWKILGADVLTRAASAKAADVAFEYVAAVADQDAYAASGQKCSAQSCLFMHRAWVERGLVSRLSQLAAKRNLAELTIGPVLSWTTERMLEHVAKVTRLVPNSVVAFGGKPLEGDAARKIPPIYGALEPTAIRMHIRDMLASDAGFEACTTEVFGPVQILVEYDDDDMPLVLRACERMTHHLTCAVVSRDPVFLHRVLSATINGTTYAGVRARTTGAPTNHWFGPAGDPRAAGIGTPEAIAAVWTTHREIVRDELDPESLEQVPKCT